MTRCHHDWDMPNEEEGSVVCLKCGEVRSPPKPRKGGGVVPLRPNIEWLRAGAYASISAIRNMRTAADYIEHLERELAEAKKHDHREMVKRLNKFEEENGL